MDKLTVDKKLFMSAMKNLAEFLDRVCEDIAADNMDWSSYSVYDWLIPVVRDLEAASGIPVNTEWVEISNN